METPKMNAPYSIEAALIFALVAICSMAAHDPHLLVPLFEMLAHKCRSLLLLVKMFLLLCGMLRMKFLIGCMEFAVGFMVILQRLFHRRAGIFHRPILPQWVLDARRDLDNSLL